MVYALGCDRTAFTKQVDKNNAPVEAENLAKLFDAYRATAAHGKCRMAGPSAGPVAAPGQIKKIQSTCEEYT